MRASTKVFCCNKPFFLKESEQDDGFILDQDFFKNTLLLQRNRGIICCFLPGNICTMVKKKIFHKGQATNYTRRPYGKS